MNRRNFLTGIYTVVLAVSISGMTASKALAYDSKKLLKPEVVEIKPDSDFESIGMKLETKEIDKAKLVDYKPIKEETVKLFGEAKEAAKTTYKLNEKVVSKDEKLSYNKIRKNNEEGIIKFSDKDLAKPVYGIAKYDAVKRAEAVKLAKVKYFSFDVYLENRHSKG